MAESRGRSLNALFLLACAGGFALVFFDGRFAASVAPEYRFFAPTVVVTLYALIVRLALRRCSDRSLAEHHVDSIYFLGFLLTLVALITLFSRLSGSSSGLDGRQEIDHAFYFVGISVSTSIAGVLFRNMARGSYLRRHPEDTDELSRSYELLKSTADGFNAKYRETFESVRLFLDERRENAAALAEGESRYRESLERFVTVTNQFSASLEAAEKQLSARAETLESFNRLTGEIAASAGRIRSAADDLPLRELGEDLSRFGTGVRELDAVLDSLITLLEAKVERVR